MFEQEYKEAFSRVTPSRDITKRILALAGKKRMQRRRRLSRLALAAALIAMLTFTVSASETVQNWLGTYFSRNTEGGLSSEQIQYIEGNAQNPTEVHEEQGWAIELKATISDGDRAIVVLGVTAPEGTDLHPNPTDTSERFYLQNGDHVMNDVLFCDVPMFSLEENYTVTVSSSWIEDGDGLQNTQNVVMEVTVAPLFPGKSYRNILQEANWQVQFTSIIHKYRDWAYYEELMQTKYKGQTDVMLTHEETQRANIEEPLVEGNWQFDLELSSDTQTVELLDAPIMTQARVLRQYGTEIWEYETVMDRVEVTSIRLNGLSAMVKYTCDGGANFSDGQGRSMYVVMQDGSRILLRDQGSGGVGTAILVADSPIVLEQVDYLLLADGTMVEMP